MIVVVSSWATIDAVPFKRPKFNVGITLVALKISPALNYHLDPSMSQYTEGRSFVAKINILFNRIWAREDSERPSGGRNVPGEEIHWHSVPVSDGPFPNVSALQTDF